MNKSIIVLLSILWLISVAFADEPSPLQIRLLAPQVLLVDERPNPELEIKNVSDNILTIVRPLDGSWNHWRYPHLTINAYTVSGKQFPLELAGRCGNMNSLTTSDVVRLAPEKSIRVKTGWPFKQAGFQEAGRYAIKLTYDLAAPNLKSWQISGRGSKGTTTKKVESLLQEVPSLTATSALFKVEVKQLDESMIEQAIINYFTPKDSSFAFVEKDYVNKKWEVVDIRQSMGRISGVLKFRNDYTPPTRSQYVTRGYWLEEGRYLFMPKHGKKRIEGKGDKNIISDRFVMHVPKEAISWARRMDDKMAQELGFDQSAQPKDAPDKK